MKQTPLHNQHNPDLLAVMPSVARVVEAGCSSGALASAYKKLNSHCFYTGIEIDSQYALVAQQYCDKVLVSDLDALSSLPRSRALEAECWVFGDCLEHLIDPWRLLRWIHHHQPSGGIICACIPNAQHWSVQARLSTGDFRYESSGLLDRTHLRWFTRKTIHELFKQANYQVSSIFSRKISRDPDEKLLYAIQRLAELSGAEPQQALEDCQAFQYVVVAKRLD